MALTRNLWKHWRRDAWNCFQFSFLSNNFSTTCSHSCSDQKPEQSAGEAGSNKANLWGKEVEPNLQKKWILKNHGQWKQSWKKKSQSEWILIKNKKQRETIVYIKQSSFKAWSQNRVKWFGMLPDFPHQRALSSSRLVKDQNYKKMFGVHWHHEACNTDWRSLPENVLDMHVFLNIF